jgi:hypothetical protein
MGLLFHFLSSLKSTGTSQLDDKSSVSTTSWKDRAFWLPAARRKEQELANSSIEKSSFFVGVRNLLDSKLGDSSIRFATHTLESLLVLGSSSCSSPGTLDTSSEVLQRLY